MYKCLGQPRIVPVHVYSSCSKGVFVARVRAENVHNLSGMYIKNANTLE